MDFTCRFVATLVAMVGAARADVRLPAILSNHMVLQAGVPIAIWGRATPSNVYHLDVSSRNPVFTKQSISGGVVRLSFSNAEGGLVARGEKINGYVIAGADKQWHPATARIEGDTVVVSSAAAPLPVAVRYGWENNPDYNLINRPSLPMTHFRTDTWK